MQSTEALTCPHFQVDEQQFAIAERPAGSVSDGHVSYTKHIQQLPLQSII